MPENEPLTIWEGGLQCSIEHLGVQRFESLPKSQDASNDKPAGQNPEDQTRDNKKEKRLMIISNVGVEGKRPANRIYQN